MPVRRPLRGEARRPRRHAVAIWCASTALCCERYSHWLLAMPVRRYMVRLDGALQRAVFSLIAGDASAPLVASRGSTARCCGRRSRGRWRGTLLKLLVWLFIAAVDSFVFTTRRQQLLALPACRSLRGDDRQLALQAMLSLSMAVASEEAACAALHHRAVCFVFSTRRRRWLAMPVRRWVRHSIRDEARQLVAADDTLAVDDRSVCGSYSMARHRRR